MILKEVFPLPLFSKKKTEEDTSEDKKISFKEAIIHDSKNKNNNSSTNNTNDTINTTINPLKGNVDLKEEDFSKLEEDFSENNFSKDNNSNIVLEKKNPSKKENYQKEKNLEGLKIEESNIENTLENELPELEELPEKKLEDVNLNVKLKLPKEDYEEEIKKALEKKNNLENTREEQKKSLEENKKQNKIEEKKEEKSVIFAKKEQTFIEIEELQEINQTTEYINKIEKNVQKRLETINLQSEEENKITEQIKKTINNTINNITRIEKTLFSKGE